MPVLVVDQISKHFGAVEALKEISFTVERGEVVALVGDNGAGKSTLVNILSGVITPSGGTFTLNGQPCHFPNPAAAQSAGIETLYQHLALIEQLDVADNLYLGRELWRGGVIGRWFGWMDRASMRRETELALNGLHIKIPAPTLPVRMMSGGQRQAVALARALLWGRELLILDEPTAALGVAETEQVLEMIDKLRAERKVSFLIVSHNMQDVHRIADKIIILRQGRHVKTLLKTETTPQEIVAYITGANT